MKNNEIEAAIQRIRHTQILVKDRLPRLGHDGGIQVMNAVYALMMAEALPARLRCSVLSAGNGIAYGLFGGLTPFTATYLVERSGNDFAPVYLIAFFAVLSLAAIMRIPETLPSRRLKTA